MKKRNLDFPLYARLCDVWRQRFSSDSTNARERVSFLIRLFLDSPNASLSPFAQWRDARKRVNSPKLPPNRTFAQLLKLDDDLPDALDDDALLFVLHAYVAQTILAVLAAAFRLDDDSLTSLFGPSPFNWAAPLRDLLARDAQDVAKLNLCAVARLRDPFGDIYPQFFHANVRAALGEFYTPPELAAYLCARADRLRNANAPADAPTILDPACGAGVFLTAPLRDAIRRGDNPREVLDRLEGFDINPLALLMTKANLLSLALSPLADEPDALPDAIPPLVEYRRSKRPDDPYAALPGVLLDSLTLRNPFDPDAPPRDPRRFDLLVGNPPWLGWERLAEEYRQETRALWEEFGLFTLSGKEARYGGCKKELAALVAHLCVARDLKPDGVFGLVLPRPLFQSGSSGAGFRLFGKGKAWEFAPLEIDDLSNFRLFEYVTTKPVVFFGAPNSPAQYPFPVRRWRVPTPGERLDAGDAPEWVRFSRAFDSAIFDDGSAEPIRDEPGAPLLFRFAPRADVLDDPLAQEIDSLVESIMTPDRKCGYRAQLGANAAGSVGVFWFDAATARCEGNVAIARNLGARGKRKVESVEARLEAELLFPMLHWRDLGAYRYNSPSTLALIPQDPQKRRGYSPETMRERFPLALAYLERFEEELRGRAAYRRYQASAPFWSLYNVDAATFAPYKVAWRRMDYELTAALVVPDPDSGRPIVPQETLVFTPVASLDEGDYLAALLNSAPARRLALAVSVPQTLGFGSPKLLDSLRPPLFDPRNPLYVRLAALGKEKRLAALRKDSLQ
ncbi:MAG: N-6 DNA methylase [Thermoguttaceae bacterium]